MVLADSQSTSNTSGIYSINSNDVFPLLSSGLWRVKSGRLGIFAVGWKNGEPVGERRYLWTVDVGDLIIETEARSCDLALVAVAFEASEIEPIAKEADANGDGGICGHVTIPLLRQVERWVGGLTQVKGFPGRSIAESSEIVGTVSLEPAEGYSPKAAMMWVRPTTHQAYWLDVERFVLGPSSPLFPISRTTWLQAPEDQSVELEIVSADQLCSKSSYKEFMQGLNLFHQYALEVIEEGWQTDRQRGEQQFTARQQLNQEVTQTALQGLVSVLQPSSGDYLLADTPLLRVAGAVGHALGVKIEPPAESEQAQQVKEPLEAIARASQLRMRQVLLRGRWWRQDVGPLVAYTQDERRPVALIPVRQTHYELLEANGQRIPVTEAVARTVEPVAFMFYRPLPEGHLTAWNLLKFAFQGRQRDLTVMGLAGVVVTLLGMVLPQMTAVLVDDAIPFGSAGLLLQIGLALVAVAIGRASFQLVQAITTMRLETGSDVALQAAVWDRLLKLQTSFFRDYATGDLLSRVSSITSIRRLLSGSALDAILSGTFALLNLGLLFYYSGKLAALALVVALLIMVVTVTSGAFLLKKQRPMLEIRGELYGLMVQLINGVSKLRIAGAESRAFAQWGNKYRRLLEIELSTQQLEDSVNVFNTVIPTVTTIALFWLASRLVGPFELSTGRFLAFNAAFAIFIGGITNLSLTMIDVMDVIPLWMRSQPILAASPEVTTEKTDPGQLSGAFCVDRVTFRYREDGPLILDNVTVEAKPGEFIALVGPSGSGKSTVLRLLLGFEHPHSGTVYYDGRDMCGLNLTAIRRQLGVVLQNGHISAGSIFENISGGALITQDDAWRAAEMAGFAEDVRNFPMQLHTVVSEGGGNLSGGQRQRLIIARALALNPKLLLLDEATSALDNRTQAIVSESLDQLNVTRVVVAHRLSTIRNADRIYVIKAGRVVQVGNFDELAKQPGVFAELIKRQLA
ncbi:NHLP bacteriocin export ABC transporter permease/ATPase subunit [Leptolyngbyaceae cyanobacterium CCMR0082]|uniref:NHLP bacteriocin export ABC transporter permease/ATPase subunit n=1 Tax=Adonisia turfae CCMR0082 TaxID=2304604 RepID=A0A6M0S8J9_9CYAN|nr:NHLP bacteriocin export ABC transporter permease/ATPase subunit [Adonisia turfae]NEZ64805.1 NHLP bacteriocin export ABC transporter permease/ATPase subunit [Adonisia turfae CCMR0082]